MIFECGVMILGLGYENHHAVPPPPTGLFSPLKLDLSNSGLEEFKQPEFQSYGPRSCETESKNASKDIPNELKESPDAPSVKDMVSDNKDSSVESRVVANYNYHQRERVVSRNDYTRVNYNISTRNTHPNAHRNMAPRAVLVKTGLRPLNIAMPVNTDHPKTIVNSAIPMPRAVNIARPRAVNTARPNSAVVNDVRTNQGLGYESYHDVPPPPTGLFSPLKLDLSNSGLEEFKQPEFQSYGPRSCETKSKNASKDIPNELKESSDAPSVKDR
nr:hypothetical protein [Tanacetum cinerariifolium]